MIVIFGNEIFYMDVCRTPSHFGCVQLFVTPWTVTRQAALSMGFSRTEYWSGLPFPSPFIWIEKLWKKYNKVNKNIFREKVSFKRERHRFDYMGKKKSREIMWLVKAHLTRWLPTSYNRNRVQYHHSYFFIIRTLHSLYSERNRWVVHCMVLLWTHFFWLDNS